MRVRCFVLGLAALLFAAHASATVINVAEGKNVTLNGTFGVITCCWAPGTLAPASSLVDGAFLPDESIWQTDTVFWDERHPPSVGNSIEIDLGGTFSLTSFVVQADNNDTYRIEYWDGGSWVTAWDIPTFGNWGMWTRPEFVLGAPIVTDRLRFYATSGDQWYSVSEIQAFADVPEPATTGLLLVGGVLLGLLGRRRQH